MLIQIQSGSGPIYQQIVDQIRYRIIAGQISGGDELPTIRGLAESLKVNPNTIARAYRELENEGLVEKRRTTGTFVSQSPPTITPARRRKIMTPEIDKLLVLANHLGFEPTEFNDLVQSRRDAIARQEK